MTKRLSLIILLLLLIAGLFAQTSHDNGPVAGSKGNYEFTVYLIPSSVKYDWSSPRTLYKSFIKNYERNFFRKNTYILGHAFVELDPASGESILTGMHATDRNEQRQLVFKDHYGLAILGTGLKGQLDKPEDLEFKLQKFLKKGKMSFIRFQINEQAYKRMLDFYESYKMRLDSLGDSCQCYSGAFWPRYYGEGSGCSAFVVSFMDIVGLLRDAYDQWKVDVNIPMDLMGGPYNQDREVKFKDIKKCENWANEPGTPGVDFEPFWIYDPTLIHEWILREYTQPSAVDKVSVIPMTLYKSKGLFIDARNVTVPDDALFMHRNEPSIFIKK